MFFIRLFCLLLVFSFMIIYFEMWVSYIYLIINLMVLGWNLWDRMSLVENMVLF